MPELPDITVYIDHINARARGRTLEKVRLASPFVLRSALPPLEETFCRKLVGTQRLGKRIVLELEDEYFLVLHLMVRGRLHWKKKNAAVPKKGGLAAFDFATGTLLFTEGGTRKRASLHVVRGREVLDSFNPGGLEVLDATAAEFSERLRRENHTLKRALTDPYLFSGIGNAYSDEILFAARLSPLLQTSKMSSEQVGRLYRAARETLNSWTERLRNEAGEAFPSDVGAFHPHMSVHGRYGKPCSVCGTAIQRIVYAQNETNYCPRCQSGGKLLADRALSTLLHKDWPKTIDELESRRKG